MKLTFFISRHGQTDANAQKIIQGRLVDYPLNKQGHLQAEALAEEMKSQSIDWFVTSKLDRAIGTANHVAKFHPLAAFTTDERLNEISYGEVDGKPSAEVKPIIHAVIQSWNAGDFDAKVPGGDSASDCQERILSMFSYMLEEARQKNFENIFICVHGRILRVLMAALVDKDLTKMTRFSHTNCCYHEVSVEIDEEKPVPNLQELNFELVRLDVRDHLESVQKSE